MLTLAPPIPLSCGFYTCSKIQCAALLQDAFSPPSLRGAFTTVSVQKTNAGMKYFLHHGIRFLIKSGSLIRGELSVGTKYTDFHEAAKVGLPFTGCLPSLVLSNCAAFHLTLVSWLIVKLCLRLHPVAPGDLDWSIVLCLFFKFPGQGIEYQNAPASL